MPGAQPKDLADFFKTRDSGMILEGMANLMNLEAKRVQSAYVDECVKEEINPEVTKMVDRLFAHAEKFAKLVDPNLRTPGAQVTNQTLVLNGNTQQELASQVVNYLQAQGVPLDQITPEMVMSIVEAPGEDLQQKAIEASTALRMDT